MFVNKPFQFSVLAEIAIVNNLTKNPFLTSEMKGLFFYDYPCEK